LGRAEGIMQRELETLENNFMVGTTASTLCTCNGITPCTCNGTVPPWTSTYTIKVDDISFTINARANAPVNSKWLVNVKVTWPGSVNGITSSILVSQVY
jgi:hypothetical protein